MTTIACKGNILAADNQLTDNNSKSFQYKLFVCGDSAFAGSGDYNSISRFSKWAEKGFHTEKPLFKSDEEDPECFRIIQLKNTGEKIYWDETLTPYAILTSFVTEGSGGGQAYGAMLAGKGPVEAVYLAGLSDAGTGYGVSWVRITDEGGFELNYEDANDWALKELKVPKRYKGQ
jgi:hypothetical protein